MMSPLMPWTSQCLGFLYNDTMFVHQIFEILLKVNEECFCPLYYIHSFDLLCYKGRTELGSNVALQKFVKKKIEQLQSR